MTVEEINQFVKTAEPGDRVIYYRGFLAEDAGLSKEKRDFASFVLSLESFISTSTEFPVVSKSTIGVFSFSASCISGMVSSPC